MSESQIVSEQELLDFVVRLRGIADSCEMSLEYMKKHGIPAVETGNYPTGKRGLGYMHNFSKSLHAAVIQQKNAASFAKVAEEPANYRTDPEQEAVELEQEILKTVPKPQKRKKNG